MNDITKELLNIMESIDILYQDGTIFNSQAIQDLKTTKSILDGMLSTLTNKRVQEYFKQVK